MSVPYPLGFPPALSEGWGSTAAFGTLANALQPGPVTVRRKFRATAFNLVFTMTRAVWLNEWKPWADEFGWAAAGVAIALPAWAGAAAATHELRFVGPAEVRHRDDTSLELRVAAELITGGLGRLPAVAAVVYDPLSPLIGDDTPEQTYVGDDAPAIVFVSP